MASVGTWRGPALGLGAMRLATAGHPPADVALAIMRHAFDRGLRLVDTADSYGVDQADMHAGERLVRQAIAGWSSADREQVLVATKAGLVRPGGRWLPDGRPDHLRAACEGSLVALGVDALPLWQLHVRDRKVPWEESLGALASLYREGKVARLGLCNVSADDLQTALRLLPPGSLACVQNALSPFEAAGGHEVLALAKRHRLAFLAHSPLGGHRGAGRITKRPVFYRIADKHGVSPQAVVLAWLMTLGDNLVPLFGATRMESVDGSVQALTLALDEADVRALDQAFPKAASLRAQAPPPEPVDETGAVITLVSEPLPPPGTSPEVVMIIGIPGAGKSTLVAPYLEAGYLRLNRDELGGKLDGLIPPLRNALAGPSRRVVLDNTYPTRRQRAPVLEAAREAGVPVRLLWLDTPLDEARWNVARRMIERHGRLLGPEEIAAAQREDANTIPPRAQSTWIQAFETPRLAEGFERVERRAFERRDPPGTVRGLLLDVDGTLRRTRSGEPYPRTPGDLELLPRRREILARWQRDGWRLFFVSNQSGVHSGRVTRGVVDQAFRRTIELLGLPIDEVVYCPHQAFPVACFCRKPMPGLVTWLVTRHGLDRRLLTIVGDQPADVELARSVGARFIAAETFFGPG
ncbi:MAG: HAD-IIIA family hydrolase [Deltaproteobacteria bacterium]|nr:HAD-IIIA family hydrolase [Deltaproteobacteria bacterium]